MKHLLVGLLFCTCSLQALDFHVAPGGNDANPGTAVQPFATIGRARDVIRGIKTDAGLPTGGIQVWLHTGYYNQSESLSFDARDSGTSDAPIVYASPPGEWAQVTGAVDLSPDWFVLVTPSAPVWPRLDPSARGQVYAANLREHGINNFGSFRPRGFSISAAAPLELFMNGQPMTLARWPNEGDPPANTAGSISATEFGYSSSRQDRWTQARDIWLHGFWEFTWADFHVPVAKVDPSRKIITLGAGPPQFGITDHRPYYAYNLLEEIDQPGEYYLDRDTGILYFWPLTPLEQSHLQASNLETTLLELNNTEYLTWRDISFEATRGSLVRIVGGAHNRLEGCLLRNAGQFALEISGTDNGIDSSEIANVGEDGVLLGGGDRKSLRAGGNFVTNSRIRRTGRVGWTYRCGINFTGGSGNRAMHNLIDDMPHAGILFSGNNHLIEMNEIRRVGQQASDVGAIYATRDFGYRGNVIRGNYIHHIETRQNGDGVHAVYLDDCLSGVDVIGNVIYAISNGSGVFCGGGRDNRIENNVIADTGLAHYNDDRGRNKINDIPGDPWNLLERLRADGVQYQAEPWATAYPALAAVPSSWGELQTGVWRNPQNSTFSRNVGWTNNVWTFENNSQGFGVFSLYASFADNNPSAPELFTAEASLDRSLRPLQLSSDVPGFQPIAFRRIGPYPDGWPAPSIAPSAPTLFGRASWDRELTLAWSDNSNLAREQETGFELQQRDADGSWRAIRSFNTDVDFTVVGGLQAGTTYLFRVRASNALGTSISNELALTTWPPPPTVGTPTRIEFEAPLNILTDVGNNGGISIADANLDSGQSVRLFDAGDAVQAQFTVKANGNYRISVRLRSGGANAITAFWPGGYQFRLDGATCDLTGDRDSVSAFDAAYGGCYWGTMAADVALAAGPHTLDVVSNTSWAVADYMEFAPLTGGAPPQLATNAVTISGQPIGGVAAGSVLTLAISTNLESSAIEWRHNGAVIPGAGSRTLTIGPIQPADIGIYSATVAVNGSPVLSNPVIVGIANDRKVMGDAGEVGSDIVHANGNIYDQVLLQGRAASVRADPGQIVRTSVVDLNNDIVQVEFSGTGTLSMVLDESSGPAAPVNYQQSGVSYMKGHLTIVITDGDDTTNVSLFSVGRNNAVNQGLFRSDVDYDGVADLAALAIVGPTGRFGGVRAGNASFWATQGITGLYAPGISFTGPVYLHNINAIADALPKLVTGSSFDVEIAGGDLAQTNMRPVEVGGLTRLSFVAGTNSHGQVFPVCPNRAHLEENGRDVTSEIVSGPP